MVLSGYSTHHHATEVGACMAEAGIVRIDVRTMWRRETDFTFWLAEKENLDLLGKALDMKLELIRPEYSIPQEHPKGPLRLDILARKADTDTKVAIENQLKETDISHLDRLLAYAKGCDAHVAIWVAPEFQHEYANVLHWLNELTGEEIKFYGAKIEVIRRSSDARCEPRFRKVVYPDGPQYIQKYYDFFQPLIDQLIDEIDFADKDEVEYYFDYTGRYFPSRRTRGVGYAASFEGNDAWVTLHIDALDSDLTKEMTKEIFDRLQCDQEQIEARIASDPAPEWHWRRHNPHKYSSINIRRDGSVDDPPRELEETRAWMLDLLPKLKKVFDCRVAEIRDKLPGREVD